MKFRCERDTLAEAIGTAQRAVVSPHAARSRCSRAFRSPRRATASSSSAPTSSSRSGSQVPAEVDETGARPVVPAKLFGEIVRKLERRAP